MSAQKENAELIDLLLPKFITWESLIARAYTPVWTATTTNPALGNGTLTGQYFVVGALCRVDVRLVIGSTSTLGAGFWELSLPLSSVGAFDYTGDAKANNPGVANYIFTTRVKSGLKFDFPLNASGYVAATSPFTWVDGASIDASFWYRIA